MTMAPRVAGFAAAIMLLAAPRLEAHSSGFRVTSARGPHAGSYDAPDGQVISMLTPELPGVPAGPKAPGMFVVNVNFRAKSGLQAPGPKKPTRGKGSVPMTMALLGVGPADSLDTGCGGGRTGGGTGISVTADGQVASWQRYGPAPRPRVIRKTWVDTARASRIFRALHNADFRSLPRGKPSNWTCFFTFVGAQDTHEVLFQKASLPKALRGVDSLIQVLAREADGP